MNLELWDKLNCHKLIPNCTCVHPWRYGYIRLAKLYRTEDQIIQFLIGLNESFSVVKTQILLMDPLPSINKVYSSVVQEEIQNDVVSTPLTIDESSISINVSDSRKVYPRGKRPTYYNINSKNGSRFCTFCNRNNHTVEFASSYYALTIASSYDLPPFPIS